MKSRASKINDSQLFAVRETIYEALLKTLGLLTSH